MIAKHTWKDLRESSSRRRKERRWADDSLDHQLWSIWREEFSNTLLLTRHKVSRLADVLERARAVARVYRKQSRSCLFWRSSSSVDTLSLMSRQAIEFRFSTICAAETVQFLSKTRPRGGSEEGVTYEDYEREEQPGNTLLCQPRAVA